MNTITNHVGEIDKSYELVPSRGTIATDTESGPLSAIINNWINEGAANNRLEYIKTVLSRLGKPFDMQQVSTNPQAYQQTPPLFKSVLDDILNITLNYRNPDNIDALTRASIDYGLMANKDGVNYHTNGSSGNAASDIYNLVKATESIVMLVKTNLNNKADIDAIVNLLMVVKNSGDEVSYSLLLKMLNKIETYNHLIRVMVKELTLINQLPAAINITNGTSNTSVAFNSNINVSNKTMGDIVNTFDNLFIQESLNMIIGTGMINDQNLMNGIQQLIVSIKEIVPVDVLRAFNGLCNPTTENWIQSIFMSDPNTRNVLNYSIGLIKGITNGQKLPSGISKMIAFTFITEYIKNVATNLNPAIANDLLAVASYLEIALLGRAIDNTVSVNNIELTDAVAYDILSGCPVYTAIFFNTNPILQTTANLLFRVNTYNGKPLLSIDAISKMDKGTSYNPNTSVGLTYTQVRTYLETIPELKVFVNPNQPNNQFDDVVTAIYNALTLIGV